MSYTVAVQANEGHKLLSPKNTALCSRHPVQMQGEIQLRLLS